MSTTLEDMMSPAQVARRLDVTPARVRQMLDRGELPYVATPLGRLVEANDVNTLLEKRRVAARATRPAPAGRVNDKPPRRPGKAHRRGVREV